MKKSMLLVLALAAVAYAVLFVYCGTALGLPLHGLDLTLHLVLLAGDIAAILLTRRWVRFGLQLGISLGAGLLLCGYLPTMLLYYRIGFVLPLLCLSGIAVLLAVLAVLPLVERIREKIRKA